MFSYCLQFILTIILFIISIRFFLKGYKSSDSEFEKSLYILFSCSVMFLVIVYYLDRYNIPSMFGYTRNINSSDWVGILTNYSAVIISTLLNAIFLLFVTFKQIEVTFKDNLKLNNESQRLQNLPLLRYDFINEKITEKVFDGEQTWIFSNHDNSNNDSIDFTMEIENIGLNAVRKVYIEMESKIFNRKEYLEFCNQSSIEKNQKKVREFIITNVSKGNYEIDIIVYYQDLLKNWYKQKVHLIVSLTGIYHSNYSGSSVIDSVTVEDEERLSKSPSIIKKVKITN